MKRMTILKTTLVRLSVAIIILSALFTEGIPTGTGLAATTRVAYVYSSINSPTAVANRDLFNTMLAGKTITMDAYDETTAGTANFTPDQTIIVADDGGATGTFPTDVVTNIQNSGKPVVGIGSGGLLFFNQISLLITPGNSITASAYNVHAADYYAPIWQLPNQVTLTDQAMAIYNSAVSVDALSNPDPIQVLTRIGRLPGDPNHYSLISQNVGARCYTLWGYRGTPDVMTPSGANLFVNLTFGSPCDEGKYVVTSVLATTPPAIDGVLNYGEWTLTLNPNRLEMDHGFFAAMNDNIRLYLFLDVLESNINNNVGLNQNDFWVTFDTNNNGVIDPNVDLNYGTEAGTHNMRYQQYINPAQWTLLFPTTKSSLGPGFDCYTPDNTKVLQISPPQFTCNQHQIWEIAIDLHEINALPGQIIHMGLRTHSPNPNFTDEMPNSFDVRFNNLIELHLAGTTIPTPTPGSHIGFAIPPFEITQVVQDVNNSIPLIADKTTAGRVSVHTTGATTLQPVIEYLYGARGGNDLPGSPLAQLVLAPPSVNRANLTDTGNFLLPPSWITTGEVFFHAEASDYNGNSITSPSQLLTFRTKTAPVYWMIQENYGTANAPNLMAQSTIDIFESYVKTVFPVPNVTFVQKPWTVLGALNGMGLGQNVSTIAAYYNTIAAVYWNAIMQNKVPPYALPDQIFGAGNFGGGLSDPTWFNNGGGRAAAGGSASSGEGVTAHEFNHNLDRTSSGTWGHHVAACGASGPDPNWPFGTDPAIHEYGFDTRLPWQNTSGSKTVIPPTWPDLMSYCGSGMLPTKWVAPYRYQNWITSGFPLAPVKNPAIGTGVAAVNSLYISGSLAVGGTGLLDPVLLAAGTPLTPSAAGAYTLQVLGSGGTVLESHSFDMSFVDSEGNPLPTVYFHFVLSDPGGVTGIKLLHGAAELASITKSVASPVAAFSFPGGGESFSGTENITWTVSDSDTPLAQLSQTLEYSADNGSTWTPVAMNLPGTVTTYALDTNLLPMSNLGKLRLWVSDGLNNIEVDSSGTFSVPNHPPKADIIQPGADGFVSDKAPVILEGQATDLEDSSIPDNKFQWTLDGSTLLGLGANLPVVLPQGKHTLTLTVLDSQGATGTATITVFVQQYRLMLPALSKN